MFRQPSLPHALLSVALGVALLIAPAPVRSQDRSTQERLDRLERDLNMLQRQVYRGSPAAQAPGGDGGAAVGTEIRMNRLEEQMRDLTGRVEEFMNQIAQVRQRLEQINGDVETRFSQGGGVSGPLAATEPAPSRPGPPASRAPRQFPAPPPDPDDDSAPLRLAPGGGRGSLMPGTVVPPPGGPIGSGPAPIFGTLTPPGPAAAMPPGGTEQMASAAPAGHPGGGGALPGGSPAAQYNHAFGLLKQADYPGAETELRAFVEQHPKDPMAGNAQYWLGETFYTRSKFLDAARAFAEGYKRYPKSAKAADGLLKLGMSLGRAGQKQEACVAFGQLDQAFPNPGGAIKSHAEAEEAPRVLTSHRRIPGETRDPFFSHLDAGEVDPGLRRECGSIGSAPNTAPLTLDELAASLAAIGGFEARPLVAVAVSGGPDSMALVLLADRWARRRGGRVFALTVDHGLRPESGAEAQTVAGWLAARGIRHAILRWQGDKPASGIQAAAREARYRLLAEWCRAQGVLHLLTAHQREDQAETHLIRRRAGSGIDGLAAMSAARELPGCRLVRPLLTVPKARLAALLAAEGQPFLRDPSNLDPTFERARLRLAAAGMASVEDISNKTRACGRQRIERERALDDLLARAVALHPAGFAVLDMAAVATASDDSAERLLGRVAACVGGARYPARRARLKTLRAALAAQPERARTLGGCRLVPWRGRLLVLREPAAAAAPALLDPGASLVWDRRIAAELSAMATGGFTLGYLGDRRIEALDCRRNNSDDALPRLVYPVLPALWDGAGLAAVPPLGYRRRGAGVLPRLYFCPANRLTRASFTVV